MKKTSNKKADPNHLRCLCGSLVARIVDGNLELKCKRCKRIHLLPLRKSSPASGKETNKGDAF
ncbi:hypothetical protein MNODULE_06635 [Nitrospiraceae bacterium HYJII51-Mn-bac16s-1-B09]|uniref:Com family DNA-binding transcriptional regulator n=1 Tax=Candidatus Manganitrophus noduliformans TaxID=2606439 RepID=A0A7X6DP10_9BACT|nr:hypothetical protein [Candidatus Manganitrophus noduliformans]